MIDLKSLRKALETYIKISEHKVYVDSPDKRTSQRITIKRKKKMILEQIPNGDIKLKRRSVIKIEIIE